MLILVFLVLAEPAIARSRNGSEPESDDGVALVLAGGGALGFAHVGVIRALEEAGVEVDLVVGTSIGSVVGALYAAGYSATELNEIAKNAQWRSLLFDRPERQRRSSLQRAMQRDYTATIPFYDERDPSDAGVSQGQRVVEYLDALLEAFPYEIEFDRLPRRFRAVAADIVTGEEVIFDSGDLKSVVRASMAVPGLFAPIRYQGHYLVDGGLVNNVPVDVARDLGYERIITVRLSRPTRELEDLDSPSSVITQSARMLRQARQVSNLALSSVVIAPDLEDYSSTDFARGEELVELGYRAALGHMDELRALASAKASRRRLGPAADAAVSGTLYIGAVRALPQATLSRQLRAELEASLLGEHTPAYVRKTIYAVYDRGDYARAWYQLRPAAREGRRARSVRVSEDGETSYTLWFDGRLRDAPRSLLSAGFSLEAEALGPGPSQFSGNLAYTGFLGEGKAAAWSAESSLGDEDGLRLSFFGLATERFLLGAHAFAWRESRYFYGEKQIRAVYDHSRLAASLEAGIGLADAVEFALVGFAGYEWGETRLGEAYLPDLAGYRLGGRAVVAYEQLDRRTVPRRGAQLGASAELAARPGGTTAWTDAGSGTFAGTAAGYVPLGDTFGLRGRLAYVGMMFGRSPLLLQPAVGGLESVYGYSSQELRANNTAVLGGDLRFRLFSLPIGIGDAVYAQSGANVAALWPGVGLGKLEQREYYPGYHAGLVADTVLGAFHLHVGVSQDGAVRAYVGLGNGAAARR